MVPGLCSHGAARAPAGPDWRQAWPHPPFKRLQATGGWHQLAVNACFNVIHLNEQHPISTFAKSIYLGASLPLSWVELAPLSLCSNDKASFERVYVNSRSALDRAGHKTRSNGGDCWQIVPQGQRPGVGGVEHRKSAQPRTVDALMQLLVHPVQVWKLICHPSGLVLRSSLLLAYTLRHPVPLAAMGSWPVGWCVCDYIVADSNA